MKLVKLSASLLHFLESGQFIVSTINDINSVGVKTAADADFESYFVSLKNQSEIFNKAIGQMAGQTETALLYKQDQDRDRKIATLRRAWNVHKYSDIAERKTAFEGLKILMSNYKKIEFKNYEAESLGLDNLLGQLRNTTNQPFLKILGLDEHVEFLNETNELFKTTFKNRSSNVISTVTYNTAGLRREIFNTYKKMTDYVTVMANLPDRPFFVSILNAINNTRTYYYNIIARRVVDDKTDTARHLK